MRGFNCEIGEKFGDWTVIDNNYTVKFGHRYVKVQCKCGKIKDIELHRLKHGKAKACGSCAAKKKYPEIENIKIGSKYKHWTVIDGPKKDGNFWKYYVQCDCGKSFRWIPTAELLDKERCFQCIECAAKERNNKVQFRNGRVGDLTINKYNKLKINAKVRDIEFNISIEYLWNLFEKQQHTCAITGDYIDNIKNASLDRIDSNIGYIEGNVQWVTTQANLSKHIMSMTELYEFCRKVLNHANQQPSTPLTKCEGSETNS